MINKKDVYSDLKYVHWLPQLMDIKNGKIVAPVNLQIDPTNICNHDCSFCYYHVHELGDFVYKEKINREVMLKTLDDLLVLGGKSVEWTGGGEPFVHKDFDEFSQKARSNGFEQALVTNGQLLDKHIDEVLDFSWVRVSVNGGSNSYEKVHRVRAGVRDTVWKNIEDLAGKKKDGNVLGISNVVCADNWMDIYEIGKYAKERGADNYRISLAHTDDKDAPFLNIWGDILDQIDKTKDLQDDDFRVFSFSNRIATIARKEKGGFCFYHHLTTALGANGELYPCCYFKYLPEFSLGNVNEMSLVDIWFGDKRKEFIDGTAKDCWGHCWMGDKNKLAAYITSEKDEAPHINFP